MSLTTLGPDKIATALYRYDNVHEAVASPADLNESHFKQFHELGFIAVDHVFTPAEVSEYSQAITDLIAKGDPKVISFEDAAKNVSLTPEQREGYVRKCMYFVNHDTRLLAMSKHPVLVGIIEKLVGSTVRMIQDMALLKPPHIGREKPWHQDMAYFAISPPEKVLGTWTALDPATIENGCMHVIPGSHRSGPKPHYHDRDCQLNDEDVAVEQDVVVPLAPGGVLFFGALIHHGTPPNRSSVRRRAIQLHYASTECVDLDGEGHNSLFHDTVGYAGCRGFSNGMKPRPVVSKPEHI